MQRQTHLSSFFHTQQEEDQQLEGGGGLSFGLRGEQSPSASGERVLDTLIVDGSHQTKPERFWREGARHPDRGWLSSNKARALLARGCLTPNNLQ